MAEEVGIFIRENIVSLIHQALKKAEKPAEPKKKNIFSTPPSTDFKPKSNLNKRTIVLGVIVVCALGIALYLRLSGTSSKPAPTPKVPGAEDTASQQLSRAEATRLKDSAALAYRSGDLNQAWIGLNAAYQINKKDPEILNNLGFISKRRGNKVEARRYYEQALSLRPDYPECLNNIAVLDMEEGKDESAKERLTRALAINPHYADANFNMALISERMGDDEGAVKYYLTFLRNAQNANPTFLEEVRKHVVALQE